MATTNGYYSKDFRATKLLKNSERTTVTLEDGTRMRVYFSHPLHPRNGGTLWRERHELHGSHELAPAPLTCSDTLRSVLVELQQLEQRVIEELREMER